ncbi:YggU family protein [Candidatus Woesearchaeota archaeon]|nr:YggU family protein [Candidatus Woesearchaeota archaeon]
MNLPIKNNILEVKVVPNASKTENVSIENNIVKVRIAAPPDKNKANVELLKFLKKEFGLKFKIKSGATSREKVLELVSE